MAAAGAVVIQAPLAQCGHEFAFSFYADGGEGFVALLDGQRLVGVQFRSGGLGGLLESATLATDSLPTPISNN